MVENPILQFEYKRITKAARETRYSQLRKSGYIALIFLTLVAFSSLILFPNVPFVRPHQVSFAAVLPIILQAVLTLVLLQRTLLRATLIVGRERTSTWNWEAFVLTGLDAPTVVIGKWRAVVRSLWREFCLLGILRAAVFPIAMLLHRVNSEYPYMIPERYTLAYFTPPTHSLLFVTAAVLLLTLVQLPLMAALGVLAGSRRSTQPAGYGRALSTWLLISMGTAFIIMVVFFGYNQYIYYVTDLSSTTYYSWLPVERGILYPFVLCAITIADTGILSPFALVSSTLAFDPETFEMIGVISFSVVLILYSFLTWTALRLSIWLSCWQGMIKVNSL